MVKMAENFSKNRLEEVEPSMPLWGGACKEGEGYDTIFQKRVPCQKTICRSGKMQKQV